MKSANQLGVQATTEDGRLIGPFNVLQLHPEVSEKLSDFQFAESTHTILSPQVRELVILMVGAVWGAHHELYAQNSVGREAGLSDHAIATLAKWDIAGELNDQEMIAALLTYDLLTHHRVDDGLHRRAEQAFGTTGLFDITAVMGVYLTVCTGLILFDVPVPCAAADPRKSSDALERP
ncbi:carboxymuconolactone decarboxylase family protein [Paraburkholderia pallida]|uniref:carboxymuconolactone decarboxylase family protein n=1 Tax=Paraburkholderia pallida TaxID=2547399 RepID=UPI0018D8F102|nr:carboxymuconolactone decarboxylase family protein [Paraburkholderia pallida]